MTPNNIQEQLIKYLTDAHSIEQQALAQMKAAPKLAGDPEIAAAFDAHRTETETHERLITERLEARGAQPSKLKDVIGTLTGKGFGAFAGANPDTPGKLVVHAYSYEHMEEAAYDLLGKVAQRAGDEETVETAHLIEDQERAMAERLESLFDNAVNAALRDLQPDDLGAQLGSYLTDAHAIEGQSLALLDKGPAIAEDGELAIALADHRVETLEHQRLIDAQLALRGDEPSKLKDAALRLGGLNWGAFFGAQPDTPAKLAAFAYAFEHLEIGAYELLRRVAMRAGDTQTAQLAERILAEERAAAERLRSLFGQALDVALEDQGVAAR